MPHENIRDIKEVINNPVLLYGVLRSDHTRALPIELNDSGDTHIDTNGD